MAFFLHKSNILLNFVSKFKSQLIYRMNNHKLGPLHGNVLHTPKSSIPVVYQFVRNRLVANNIILTFASFINERIMTTVRVTVVTADRKESPAYRARIHGTQETFIKYGDPGVPQKRYAETLFEML